MDYADERTRLDRREQGDEAAEDTREEYTSYRKAPRDRSSREDEAKREAELQPGPGEERDQP